MSNSGGMVASIEDNDGSIAKACEFLKSLNERAFGKALYAALKRAGTSGSVQMAKSVKTHYFVTSADFKSYTNNTQKINHDNGGATVGILYSGWRIPLLQFDTKIDKDGRVTARVKRSSRGGKLIRAFKQRAYGRLGIWARISEERYPIKQLYGPATPQMMYSNKEITDETAKKINETFEKRIEQEINAILNGWRSV